MLQNKKGGLEFIDERLPIYLPLHYFLLYLCNKLSWQINYPLINRAWVPRDRVIDVNDTVGENFKASNNKANKANIMRQGYNKSKHVL